MKRLILFFFVLVTLISRLSLKILSSPVRSESLGLGGRIRNGSWCRLLKNFHIVHSSSTTTGVDQVTTWVFMDSQAVHSFCRGNGGE